MGISLTLAADQRYTSHVYVDYSVGLNVIHTNKFLGGEHVWNPVGPFCCTDMMRLGHDDGYLNLRILGSKVRPWWWRLGRWLKLRTEKPQWGRKEYKGIEKAYQRKVLYSLGYGDPNSTLSINENMTMEQDKGHILLKNKTILFHFPLKSNVDKVRINRSV